MMRFLRLVILMIFSAVVLTLSVANREVVRVNLAPDLTAYGLPPALGHELPLFVVALACGTIGFILGAAREYLREGKHRREAKARLREIGALRKEIDRLRSAQPREQDEDILLLTSR